MYLPMQLPAWLKLKTIAIISLAISLPSLTTAEKQPVLHIATDLWQTYTHKNGNGLYQEILNRIYTPLGIKVNFKYMPYSRSVATLLNGEAHMTLGNYKETFKTEWYADCPMVEDNVDVALSKQLYEQWQGPKTLIGKRVVSSYGMNFNQYYQLDDVIYSEVRNNELMVKMLISGRTDAIIHYRNDIELNYKRLGQENLFLIRSVFNKPSYFVFYDSPEALRYKEIFETQFKGMIASGEWKKLVLKYLKEESYYPDYTKYCI